MIHWLVLERVQALSAMNARAEALSAELLRDAAFGPTRSRCRTSSMRCSIFRSDS